MKQRSPIAVFLLPFVTFGIYSLVWQVKTKNEMKQLGADIPTAWLLIVPFVNIYWLWKYSEGVEKVTNGSVTAVLAFVLQFLLGSIGEAILQNEFNKPAAALASGAPGQFSNPAPTGELPSETTTFTPPSAPARAEPLPDASFGGPVTPAVPERAQPPALAPSAPVVPSGPTDAQPTQQS